MKTTIKIACPYCGVKQGISVPFYPGWNPKTLHTCDVDFGGCNRDFVIGIQWSYETEIHKLIGPNYGMSKDG